MAPFGALVLIALGLRLWGLGERAIHYDESLHAFYSWQLFTGDGYRHEPWIHGPLQFHLNALVFATFWDSDYTARLSYALLGAALVGLPYYLRDYLGRPAALIASVLLALSPALLYFSRYSRNDIYMAFWALALFVLMWRYLNEHKNRYLYLAAAVLALAFATKETAYIIVAIFGLGLFLLSLKQIISWLLGRSRLSEMTGPAAFLLLLGTLTLPQWAAMSAIFQGSGSEGLVLAYNGTEPGVPVGLPLWGGTFVTPGVINLPSVIDGLILGGIVAAGLGAAWIVRRRVKGVAVSLTIGGLGVAWVTRRSIKGSAVPLTVAALGSLAYTLMAFIHFEVAQNYLVAGAILITTLVLSVVVGLMWRWRVWLISAGIFYLIWITLYTSVFSLFGRPFNECPDTVTGVAGTACTKLGGAFTGVWQSFGYWLAQQDVARGNQPWYYYFVLGSVYEYLPLLLGGVGIIYYLRKGGFLGLFLVFWSVSTFVAFTFASEKMPWLLVNITVPFILLTAKLAGDLVERLPWRRLLGSLNVALLLTAPLFLVAGIYLLKRFVAEGAVATRTDWLAVGLVVLLGLLSATLIYRARPAVGMSLVALGIGALLLGSSAFVAIRASYGSDDFPVEMLVYAGASADVRQVATDLRQNLAQENLSGGVQVDYEVWYPFNWYVRNDNFVEYRCYKDETEGGYVDWCSPLKEAPSAPALLLLDSHGRRDATYLTDYTEQGPYRDLLWFPESYRRRGENRPNESFWEEVPKDLSYVKDNITKRAAWNGALDYLIHRRLGSDWWDTKFHSYFPSVMESTTAE